jgi:dTMP kinase
VDVCTGLSRVNSRNGEVNHFDEKDVSFHQRIREGYINFSVRVNDKFVRVDANQPLDNVIADVISVMGI